MMSSETATIPGPPGLPFIGNISDIDAENPIQSICNLTDTYGTYLCDNTKMAANSNRPNMEIQLRRQRAYCDWIASTDGRDM